MSIEKTERALLGLLMASPGAAASEDWRKLSPDCFSSPRLGFILTAILDAIRDDGETGLLFVERALGRRGRLAEAGGGEYLSGLLDTGFLAEDRELPALVRSIRTEAARRLVAAANLREAEDIEAGASVPDILANRERATETARGLLPAPGDDVEEVDDPAGIIERDIYTGPRYATGIPALDDLMKGGLAPGVVVIGGGPHTGKTMLSVQLARRFHEDGAHVLVLADDESRVGIVQRFGQGYGLAQDEISPDYPNVLKKLSFFADGRFRVSPDPKRRQRVTIEDAVSKLVSTAPAGVLRVLVVDNLQRADCAAVSDGDPERIKITKAMDALVDARDRHGLLVIANSELNRGGYASPDPTQRSQPIASFAESRAIEYGADVAMHLTEEGRYVRAKLVKNRIAFRRGTFRLLLDGATATFREVDEAAAERESEEIKEQRAKDESRRREADLRGAILRVLSDSRVGDRGIATDALTAKVGKNRDHVRGALALLVHEGTVETFKGQSNGGARPNLYRLAARQGGELPARTDFPPKSELSARGVKSGQGMPVASQARLYVVTDSEDESSGVKLPARTSSPEENFPPEALSDGRELLPARLSPLGESGRKEVPITDPKSEENGRAGSRRAADAPGRRKAAKVDAHPVLSEEA